MGRRQGGGHQRRGRQHKGHHRGPVRHNARQNKQKLRAAQAHAGKEQVGATYKEPTLGQWNKAIKVLGLVASRNSDGYWQISGTLKQFSVHAVGVPHRGRSHWTVVCTSERWPHDMRIGPNSFWSTLTRLDTRSVKTGDLSFDQAVSCAGPTEVLLALLHADLRKDLARWMETSPWVLHKQKLQWKAGETTSPREFAKKLERLMNTARKLWTHKLRVSSSLLKRATSDPHADVRIMACQCLFTHFPEVLMARCDQLEETTLIGLLARTTTLPEQLRIFEMMANCGGRASAAVLQEFARSLLSSKKREAAKAAIAAIGRRVSLLQGGELSLVPLDEQEGQVSLL